MTPENRTSVRIIVGVVAVAIVAGIGLFVLAPMLDHHREVLAVREALPAGTTLTLPDLQPIRRPREVPRSECYDVGHSATLVGARLTRPLEAGQVIRKGDVEHPPRADR